MTNGPTAMAHNATVNALADELVHVMTLQSREVRHLLSLALNTLHFATNVDTTARTALERFKPRKTLP